MKKLDVNDNGLAHFTQIMLLHYLVKFGTSHDSGGRLQQQ